MIGIYIILIHKTKNIMKKIISMVSLVLGLTITQAQNAEKIFSEYSKFEAISGVGLLVSKQSDSYNSFYRLKNSVAAKYGLKYNFYQKNNTNFSIGAYIQSWDLREEEKLGYFADMNIASESGPYTEYIIPVEYSKIYSLNNAKTYFYYSLGLDFIFDFDNDGGSGGFEYNGGEYGYSTLDNAKTFNLGFNAGLGFYFPTRWFMINTQIKATQNCNSLLTVNQDYHYNDNYYKDKLKLGATNFSLSLSLIPKRHLFAKK